MKFVECAALRVMLACTTVACAAPLTVAEREEPGDASADAPPPLFVGPVDGASDGFAPFLADADPDDQFAVVSSTEGGVD